MNPAVVQTLWAAQIADELARAGVRTCVVSPGSRSTPLVVALAAHGGFDLPTIIDERAAAFFALGVARATGAPAAMLCTSGSAAAHYLPAIVEASCAGVPLVALTTDRPPELQQCGASQTIDQIGIYGGFVRAAFDLGAPVGNALAMRAVRRKVAQAVALARGPHPGPVQLEIPLRKPLEPAAPTADDERALARELAQAPRDRVAPPPRLAADPDALDALARTIVEAPRGLIVAGAMPAAFGAAAPIAYELAARTGYPVLAEAGSQLRFGPRPPEVAAIDHFDIALAAGAPAPAPALVIQIGAEPVAAAWAAAPHAIAAAPRWVLADHAWHDPDAIARGVIVGDVGASLAGLLARLRGADLPRTEREAFASAWRALEQRAASAVDRAIATHPRSEAAVLRAALDAAPDAMIQIGNSLPIRVIDHACRGGAPRTVIVQRGAAGIDGLVASAAGATRAGRPVLLVLGDVSFAHDVGGLLAAREASAPLAILVIDNGGGRIFAGLPVARAGIGAAFDRHFTTPPALDPAAVAAALGARGATAATPAAAAGAVATALATPGATVIHVPVTTNGAHEVRRAALELLVASGPLPARALGGNHG